MKLWSSCRAPRTLRPEVMEQDRSHRGLRLCCLHLLCLSTKRSGFFSEERHRGKTSSTLIRQTIIIVTSQSSNIKMLFESFKCQHEVFECHSITYALVTCLLPNYTGLCFFLKICYWLFLKWCSLCQLFPPLRSKSGRVWELFVVSSGHRSPEVRFFSGWFSGRIKPTHLNSYRLEGVCAR